VLVFVDIYRGRKAGLQQSILTANGFLLKQTVHLILQAREFAERFKTR